MPSVLLLVPTEKVLKNRNNMRLYNLLLSAVRRSSHNALPKHRVTPVNRIILKITRTVDPVPAEVSFELMDKANSRFRIGMTTTLMVVCVFGSVYSIRQGKKASEEHRDSIYQKNRDRHSKTQSK